MTIQDKALRALKGCFKRHGIDITAWALNKYMSQVSRWTHGGSMSRKTAEHILGRLTPTGRVRK